MYRDSLIKIAASSLVIGAAIGSYGVADSAFAAPQAKAPSAKAAAGLANQASKHLAKGKLVKAVRFAEAAVAASPANAGYRALLGRVYLAAGRFESARLVLADAVALDPANARAALNLALAQTALAQHSDAISTLDAARSGLPADDYGLALALAGEVDTAVGILEAAARAPDASAKSRQNLALAYAMANRWSEARTVAAQDLSADALDQRMTDWARFVRPKASWDQVSAILGVVAAWDPGMPVALAMVRPAAETQVAVPQPVEAEAQLVVASAAPAAPEAALFEIAQDETAKPALSTAVVAQAKPAIVPVAVPPSVPEPGLIKADPEPARQVVVPVAKPDGLQRVSATTESGRFAVQLGAFSTHSRAQLAWKKESSRVRELTDFTVAIPRVQIKSGSFYRLSVSGFETRAAAGQLCLRVRAAGGQCFIRSITDPKPVQWAARGGKRIASR